MFVQGPTGYLRTVTDVVAKPAPGVPSGTPGAGSFSKRAAGSSSSGSSADSSGTSLKQRGGSVVYSNDSPKGRVRLIQDEMGLTPEEIRMVSELRARDLEVKMHERAHTSAAGQYAAGGPTYEYQDGPDGRQYAVGGEVSIDTSKIPGDPEATLRKAQVIKRAALAPGDPSAADRAVAAAAARMEAEAMLEIAYGTARNERTSMDESGITIEINLYA